MEKNAAGKWVRVARAWRGNDKDNKVAEPSRFDYAKFEITNRKRVLWEKDPNSIEVDEKGYVIVGQRPVGMTTRRGVFAGGDVVHRPQTVVLAMKAAKEVAVGIAQYVDAIKLLEDCGK